MLFVYRYVARAAQWAPDVTPRYVNHNEARSSEHWCCDCKFLLAHVGCYAQGVSALKSFSANESRQHKHYDRPTRCDRTGADMSGRSPAVSGGPGPPAGGSRCLFILQRCLAIQLQKVALLSEQRKSGFLEANLKCFWNASLLEAMRLLEFQGYVAPGVLLVTASACALEVVRGAWARNVLKPPNNYVITVVGECLHVCYWLA
ncbi:hypothetical protein Cfor_04136 [Coptotermes formosanus]|uniref:Uncharacterized protein n=1 Tax=Coptotermes formosanus TaxID=36987 RepID=A0A6L2PQU4_COPFO|nr:hypothetical protein Cfor_04136 [Coptotermes formosanus]